MQGLFIRIIALPPSRAQKVILKIWRSMCFDYNKVLQKASKKKSTKIIKLALIYSIPIFKLHKIKNRKIKKRSNNVREIPAFISNKHYRASSSLKLIIANVRKKKTNYSHCIAYI